VRRLVIAEKGSAALRLAIVLSGGTFKRRRQGVTVFEFSREGVDHAVIGLRGHIVEIDYPPEFRDWDAADLDALLAAKPVEEVSEPTIGDAIRALAVGVDEIVIATDFDREGELIGAEAVRIAREASPTFAVKRARFSSLTHWDIEDAFRNLTDLDDRLAASARAREEVDLAWGAVLTRFLSLACGMRGREFLSVGRVQTPTLALLVERDRKTEEFVPQPYWVVTATIGDPPLTATHASERFWQRDEADAAQGRAELAEKAAVTDYSVRAIEGHRPPPFNTTSFLAEATRLGLSAARAMSLAEDLYRAGHLSYPRTDNTVYPSSLNLRATLERLRASDLAAEAEEVLAQESLRPSRGPMETTDHPPIYPTSGALRDKLKADAWRLYELVARRFLATLAPLASERDTVAEFDVGGETFFARGREIVDPGWRKYYGSQGSRLSVPALAVGDRLPVLAVVEEQRQTDPPPRYTQGHVIQEMEKQGLGTKSTRHEILQKLYDRGYVEGRALRATAAGRAVVEALEAHGGQVTRPEMTAKLEGAMDAIAVGSRSLEDVVAESRALLASVLAEMRGHAAGISAWVRTAIANEVEVGTCEKCGGVMLIRKARTGHRFLGCSKFPECRNTRGVPKTGLLVPSMETCERCGSRKLAHVHRGIANVWCATPTCSDAELTKILGV